MKRLFAALLLFPLASFAQDKIEGVGPFKIGKTKIDITTNIAKELTGKIGVIKYALYVDDEHGIITPKAQIDELVSSDRPDLESPKYVSKCAGVRVFRISKYVVADMELRSVYLIFKNDTLASFACSGESDLNEALEIKYGPAPFKLTTDTSACYSKVAGESVLLERKQTRSWQNGDIVATNRVMSLYDERCRAFSRIDLNVFSQTLIGEIDLCESQINESRINQRKRNLKDF